MPSFQVNTKWAVMSEIVPGLFISGVSALKASEIVGRDIACIVNATNEVPNLQIPGVHRMKLWLGDTEETDLLSVLDTVCDHIQTMLQDDQRVLVHCVAGVSRSAAICLAYLIKYNGMSLRSAYHLMTAKRPMVRPNLGFWQQLIKFESNLRQKSSVRLVETSSYEDGSPQTTPDVYFPIVLPPRPPISSEFSAGLPTTGTKGTSTEDKENFPDFAHGVGVVFQEERKRKLSGEKFVPKLARLPEAETELQAED